VRRRLLFAVILLSGAALAAVAVVSGGFLPCGESGRPDSQGLPESDLEAQSLELDRRLQTTDAHPELLVRLSADLIAGRCTLPDAGTELADFSRQSKPEWLRGAAKRYPGRSEQAGVAVAVVYFTLFRLQDGNPADEDTARRLAAEYRACYGIPLTLPEPARGAAVPPCWRDVAPLSPGPSVQHRP
jgi:hypothetical protein